MNIPSNPAIPFQENTDFLFNPTADSFLDSFDPFQAEVQDETPVVPYNPPTPEQNSTNAIKSRIFLRENSSSNSDSLTSDLGRQAFEAIYDYSPTQPNISAQERSLEDKEFLECLLSPQLHYSPTFIGSPDSPENSSHFFDYEQEHIEATVPSFPLATADVTNIETAHFPGMEPETVLSTTTTSSTPDITNSVSALGKRTFTAMNSQGSPSSQTQIDQALLYKDKLHADKRRRISRESSSVQEVKKSPLERLVLASYTELLKDRLIFDECKKRNPNLLQSFLDWCNSFQSFSKQMMAHFEKYKRNPDNSNFDIEQLKIDYWDLLCKKFTIPNIFSIYTLYYQDIQERELQLYRTMFFGLDEIDDLNEWKRNIDEIKTKILEIENEYNLYEQNIKDFENEKSELTIREEFFQNIKPLIIELSSAEKATYEFKKKLSIKAAELSKTVLEVSQVLERDVIMSSGVTGPSVQPNLIVPASAKNITPTNRAPTRLWIPAHEDAFFYKVIPFLIKEEQEVNRAVWEKVAQMMNAKFKIKDFTADNCWFKWHNHQVKLKKISQPQLAESHSKWNLERKTFFFEIVTPKYIVTTGENRKGIKKESWDPIAKEMNEKFKTNVFNGKNCRNKWQHGKASSHSEIWTSKQRVVALYEIVERNRILKGSIFGFDWEEIAKEMNEKFGTNVYYPKNCRWKWNRKKRDLEQITSVQTEKNSEIIKEQ